MNITKRLALAATTLVAAASAPAFAQDTIGTLQVQGQVMTSTGGEFEPAASGDPVVAGQRVLVGEGGQASVQLADGTVLSYTDPGVYTVQVPGAAVSGSTAPTTTVGSAPAGPAAGTIAAGVAVAAGIAVAVGGGSDDNDSSPPVSR